MRAPDRSDIAAPRPRSQRSPSLAAKLLGWNADARSLSVVLIFGCGLLFVGLEVVRGSLRWGFTYDGAVNGILSQLLVTGPAALLMTAATGANVLAGAALLRLAGAPAFRSLSDMVLAGFAGAVVLDAAALFLLGSVGLFGWPELVLVHGAVAGAWLAAGHSRPLLRRPVRSHFSRPVAWWPLVLAIWAGPLIVALASPAVPFLDVLPNHVAPVEHIRVFGSFATLITSPSPIYGPSRLMLGYVATLGQLTTITNLDAILSEAAFALPLTALMALAVRQLAVRLFGGSAGFWVLLTFPLTFTFMRIPDARGTVVVFPLAAWTLIRIADELHSRRTDGDGRDDNEAEPPGDGARFAGTRPEIALVCALGGAILVHPLVGLVAFTAAAGAVILYPERLARMLVPALGAGAILAVPQVLTMAGIGAPAWVGFVCVAMAFAVAFALVPVVALVADRIGPQPDLPTPWLGALVGLAVVAAIAVARAFIAPPDDPLSEVGTDFPRLLILCSLGAVISFGRWGRGWVLLGCGIAAGLAAWAASGLVGTNGLTEQAIHYEVPKAIEYWLPAMLAIGAGGALAAVVRLRPLGVLRPVAIGAVLLMTVFPVTDPVVLGPITLSGPPFSAPLVTNVQIGEHRGAESVGLALREAEIGYWNIESAYQPYPDPRTIIDVPRQQVVDALRAEEIAGRLGPSTKVLHIASSFQQWVSVPVGVFTGAIETSISLQPELSIHTDGGRLFGFPDLSRELALGYGYVVLEPAGLPADLLANAESSVASAGYRPIWTNSQATVYARG